MTTIINKVKEIKNTRELVTLFGANNTFVRRILYPKKEIHSLIELVQSVFDEQAHFSMPFF